MTTPASNTPYRAICLGLQDAGILPFGATPSSELLAECMGRLMVQQYQDVSFFTTWRNDPSVFKWGPGGNDSAARKASAAAAVLDPNVITADRCPL